MKRLTHSTPKTLIITLIVLFSGICTSVYADAPPPPPNQQGSGGDQPPGGGAPIGEGIFILTLLGAGYAAKKWQKFQVKAE